MIVLVHGVGLDRSMWDHVAELVAPEPVVTYDLLGHGTASNPEGPRSLIDFVDQLVAVINATDSEPVDLVGSSLGALIAMRTAALHPHLVRRLVLANMVFGRTEHERAGVTERLRLTESSGMQPIADLAIDRWFTTAWQREHPDVAARVHERLRTTDAGAYVKAYRVFAYTDLGACDDFVPPPMPVLAITGELDPGSTPAMSQRIADACPQGHAHVLSGIHHLPAVEAPELFATALVNFLSSEKP